MLGVTYQLNDKHDLTKLLVAWFSENKVVCFELNSQSSV